MNSELFRREAIQRQTSFLNGKVLLTQPVSHSLLTLFSIITVLAILAFLFTGQYARRVTVNGYLYPDAGEIKIFSRDAGIVSEMFAERGDRVSANQPLLSINVSRELAGGASLQELNVTELLKQKSLLEQQIQLEQNNSALELKRLQSRAGSYAQELVNLTSQRDLLIRRVAIARQKYAEMDNAQRSEAFSRNQILDAEELMLELQQELEELNQQMASANRELDTINAQLEQAPVILANLTGQLQGNISSLEQQLQETNARREIMLTAPRAGQVSAVRVTAGALANTTQPLMVLLPEQSRLQARLFVPTRAIGFVSIGQDVRIRYDAFPYQRFGVATGTVDFVDTVVLLPGESALPVTLAEPVYEIIVTLDAQSVTGYGEDHSLQAGMVLNADIVLEYRSLVDWLLDPLYSLQGRI